MGKLTLIRITLPASSTSVTGLIRLVFLKIGMVDPHDSHFLNDLLPLPYNAATVARVASHIDQVQDTLGRQMLLENPSSYLAFAESDMDET